MIESTNKFRNRDKEKELEDELEQLTKQAQEEVKEREEEAKPLSGEEETWKKRYGDLRKHQQSTENSLKSELDTLRRQITDLTKAQVTYPKTKEEVSDWAREYPDIWGVFKTMAMEEVAEAKKEIEEQIKGLRETEVKARRKTAYQELLGYHPDFEDIKETKEFHEWIERQPKWVENALYVNETDAYEAARAVDLYKADMEKLKKRTPQKDKDTRSDESARSLRSNSAPDLDSGPKKWKESDIEKMNHRDLEKYMPEIDDAIRKGNFIYDISGAAR